MDRSINHTPKSNPRVYTGTDNLYNLLIEGDVFVDKSLFIKEFLQDSSGEVILITRPRRWGKSLNMDMLNRFLAIEVDERGNPLPQAQCRNHKLFAGGEVALEFDESKVLKPLKISSYPALMKHQGQHPVISIGFKDVTGSSYEEIETKIKRQISRLYIKHRYIKKYLSDKETLLEDEQKEKLHRYYTGKLSQEDVEEGLYFLSELLSQHFGKDVYILMDEYDTPINSAFIKLKGKPDEFNKVLELFRELFGNTFKGNPYLKRGLITGILRVAKASLFSSINNVREHTLLDEQFTTSYGFTQQEVNELFDQVPTSTTLDHVKRWYNGYKFGAEVLYNPWSIMCCLSNRGVLDTYWLDSGGTQLVDEALLSDNIQQDLQKLIARKQISSLITKQISFEDIRSSIGLYSLLLFAGYLNPDSIAPGGDAHTKRCKLSIPNHEVRLIYRQRLAEWVRRKLEIDSYAYNNLMDLLATGQMTAFAERLQDFLRKSTSFHQSGAKRAEVFYSGFMSGLSSTLPQYYGIESERESGLGRADAILIPMVEHGGQAIIMEYKVAPDVGSLAQVAEEGLAQISAKQYSTALKAHGHVTSALQVCLAFCGKEMALQYDQVGLS
ncbi:MAG: AAA family ATPase [Bacteroidota bacterium]